MSRYALFAGFLLMVPAAALAQGSSASETSVVVTQGDAVIKRAPDRAWVTIASEARAPKPADAQRQAATAMTATQQAIMSRGGVAADAIKTTSYSLQPDMEYSGGVARVRGYIARNEIATSIAGMRFDVKDREIVERDALRQAVRNAMARAEAMASGAGRALGAIVRIEELGGPVVTPMPYQMMRADAAAPATPVTPGQIDIRARVTLTVAIR